MRNLQLGFISNKSTARLLRILNYIEHKNSFTLGKLANVIQVTERTIASDIKFLKDHFGNTSNFFSGSKGYYFKVIRLSEYKEKKKKLLINECLFEIIERIFYGKLNRIDELAHHYNYSETAFRRLLAQSNSILEGYDLFWTSNPLRIKGDEGSLRKFFKDFFYEGIETAYTIIPDSELSETFIREVGSKIGNYTVGSGTTPGSFFYILYITIKRVEHGNRVTIPKELQKIVFEEHDFLMFSPIGEIVERLYSVKLPKEELAWLYLVVVCKRTIDREDLEKTFFKLFNLWPEIHKMTNRFFKERAIPYEVQSQVSVYLNAFFLSRKINDQIAPALNKEILDDIDKVMDGKHVVFEKNLRFFNQINNTSFFSPRYMREICMSFTLYSEMILELYVSRKNIYFLLEGNHFICQTIRLKAIKLFGSQHKLLFVPLHMLNKESLSEEGIDLIVTNYDRYIFDYIDHSKFILINEIPDKQDWIKIARKINPLQQAMF
ncbi:HTH domain protein [Enterococcus faecalis 06-MB-DW-09]|nr:HTH domain protein [Enterococcus faecalis 06-MB-DW-09]